MFKEDTLDPKEFSSWRDVTDKVKLEEHEPGLLELHVEHFSW
jgi:hypothetical protein